MAEAEPRIAGLGYALPPHQRRNDDPVFAHLDVQDDRAGRFDGFDRRRILAEAAQLPALAQGAAAAAFEAAALPPQRCDLITGRLSLGRWDAPEDLSQLQAGLELAGDLTVLPVACEHSTFLDGLLTADALVRARRARTALVVAAGNWSHFVDYCDDVAFSIGDGAGAAVVTAEAAAGWRLADYSSETVSANAHVMTVFRRHTRDTGTARSAITFGPEVGTLFAEFAAHRPVAQVERLLARNGLAGSDITLVSYQPSASLMAFWNERLQPADHLDTIADLGNMNLATMAVNLARAGATIATDYVVIVALGWQQQVACCLLARDGTPPTPGCGRDPAVGT